MDRGAWRATVHGFAKCWTRQSNSHPHTHSGASQVGLVVKNPPTKAADIRDVGLIPGEGNGNTLQYSCLENPMDRSLAGYSPWGCKESDTTEVAYHTQ